MVQSRRGLRPITGHCPASVKVSQKKTDSSENKSVPPLLNLILLGQGVKWTALGIRSTLPPALVS